jgi:hypothetical protein
VDLVEVVHAHVGQLAGAHAGIALSRRFSSVLPLQAARNPSSCSSVTIGTGCSGTAGGFMCAMGERVISPSSSSERKSC